MVVNVNFDDLPDLINDSDDSDDDLPELVDNTDDDEDHHVLVTAANRPRCRVVRKQDDPMYAAWWIDSGCTHHMTGNLDWLQHARQLERPAQITVGNGQCLKSTTVGSVNFSTMFGTVTLQDVLYVPGLSTNLVSISQACNNGICEVTFDADKCTFRKDATGVATAFMDTERNMYAFHPISDDVQIQTLLATAREPTFGQETQNDQRRDQRDTGHPSDDIVTWHQRLGHLNYDAIITMHNQGIIRIKGEVKRPNDTCEACVMGKQANLPFAKEKPDEAKAKQFGDVLHSDLCGPMETTSVHGHRFFMTVIDEHTRWITVILLKRKSQATLEFCNLIRKLQNEPDRPTIRGIHTDNGTEYMNTEMAQFTQRMGISHTTSLRYRPQGNGIAERLNRTLCESARTMMAAAGMPKQYWGYAIQHAAHIRNRVPQRPLEHRSPHQVRFGKSGLVHDIQPFGAKALLKIPNVMRQKRDPKSEHGRYLGVSSSQHGSIFCNKNHTITTSRDFIICKQSKNSMPIEEERNATSNNTDRAVPLEEEVDTTINTPRPRISPRQHASTKSLRTTQISFQISHGHGITTINDMQNDDPTTYLEAIKRPNRRDWEISGDEEMANHERANTFTYVEDTADI